MKTVRHACEAETSMMLASFADCVRSDRIVEASGPMGTREVSLGLRRSICGGPSKN